jgi:hypothetical protein
MERVKEACSILKEHAVKRHLEGAAAGATMTIPHYINEDRSEMRGIKPGWYAMDDAGKLSSGPFCSHEECLSRGPQQISESSPSKLL